MDTPAENGKSSTENGTIISKDIETQTIASMSNFVSVCSAENGDANLFELPLDENGNLKKKTLVSQFPDAEGLKYRLGAKIRCDI